MADTDTPDVDADRPPDAMGIADAAATQPGDLHCCCGREDCVFLRHNCSVLLSVERDVHAAAKMGQVSSFQLHSSMTPFFVGEHSLCSGPRLSPDGPVATVLRVRPHRLHNGATDAIWRPRQATQRAIFPR